MPVISLRLTEEDERRFREAAARRHLTLSAFVRQTVLMRIESDPDEAPTAPPVPEKTAPAPEVRPERATKPAKAKDKGGKKKKKKKNG